MVVVVRYQGPRANGMPELHSLTPALSVLQKRGSSRGAGHRWPHVRRIGFRACGHTADSRMHLRRTDRAKLRDGDVIRLDARAGTLEVRAGDDWQRREPVRPDLQANGLGNGRRAVFIVSRVGHQCGIGGALWLRFRQEWVQSFRRSWCFLVRPVIFPGASCCRACFTWPRGLHPGCRIIGVSLDALDADRIPCPGQRGGGSNSATRKFTDEEWGAFASGLDYVPLGAGPAALREVVERAEKSLGAESRRLHYLSVPPSGGACRGEDAG